MRTAERVRRDSRHDIAEAVRLHNHDHVPVDQLVARFGVQPSTIHRWVADSTPFENRTCTCGAQWCVKETDLSTRCARCRANTVTRARAAERREASRADPRCRTCDEPLMVAVAHGLCGFCCEERRLLATSEVAA
jgi:hypothetical protein